MTETSTKQKRAVPFLFALSIFMLTASACFAGLGISPSQIIAPNLSKGSHLEKTFILSRSDPVEDLYFKVTMEGATKDWTTLDKGTEFFMPKGQQRFPITVIANIPKDAANGQYKGGIRLDSSSKNPGTSSGNGASVSLSALIQTDFTITGEQILEYNILSIGIQNSEEGSPLAASITLNNTGNVEARPTKVHAEVFDKFNTKLLESQDIAQMGSVKPFSTGDIAIPIQTKLGIGQYWARISAYRDETVQKEENLVFEIVPVGSLQKTGNLKDLICAKTAAIGETIKINGVFENTGLSDYSAKLVAEIYKNDKLIKLVESDLADVTAGKTENLSAYFAPEEPGEYTVKAHVAYSGKKTPEKETQVLVRNAVLLASLASFGLSGFMPWAAIFILFLIVVIIIMAVIFKKRNTNKT